MWKDKRWIWGAVYKKRMEIRFILLLIILGLSIGLAYIVFWKKTELQPFIYTYIPHLSNPRAKDIQTPVFHLVIDTANWKTYTDKGLHFTFKYPPNYKIIKDGSSVTAYIGSPEEDLLAFEAKVVETPSYPQQKYSSVEQFLIEEKLPYRHVVNPNNDTDWYVISRSESWQMEAYAFFNSRIYRIMFDTDGYPASIASTFRFIH